MMRVLLLSFVMTLSGAAFAANSNPWMRVCRIDQGLFLDLQGDQEYVMCFFDNAGVGAEDFFKFKTKVGLTQALQAYKNRSSSVDADQICEQTGAKAVQGSDSQGQVFDVCQFKDGSLIEAVTLWQGPGAPENEKLDQALSATY